MGKAFFAIGALSPVFFLGEVAPLGMFLSMLSGVYRMVSANASDEVKLAAAERMRFDAENAKGPLKRRASRIVECAPKKGRKKKA